MKKVLAMSFEQSYLDFAQVFIKSFLKYNHGWEMVIADVGLAKHHYTFFEELGVKVKEYPPELVIAGYYNRYFPAAKSRCMLLAEIPNDDTLMLYVDVDSIVMKSVDEMVDEFLASGKPVGMAQENDTERFTYVDVRNGWLDENIPDVFVNRGKWEKSPVINAGVLLATGDAKKIGQRSLELYDKYNHLFQHAEQTIISAVIYEDEYPIHVIPWHHHCFHLEPYVVKTGVDYIDPVYLDGKEVTIRHWCGEDSKNFASCYYIDQLKKAYDIPPPTPSNIIPSKIQLLYKVPML